MCGSFKRILRNRDVGDAAPCPLWLQTCSCVELQVLEVWWSTDKVFCIWRVYFCLLLTFIFFFFIYNLGFFQWHLQDSWRNRGENGNVLSGSGYLCHWIYSWFYKRLEINTCDPGTESCSGIVISNLGKGRRKVWVFNKLLKYIFYNLILCL